jgi:hypothetical protein
MSDARPDRWNPQGAEPSPFEAALQELCILLGAEPLAMDQGTNPQENEAAADE